MKRFIHQVDTSARLAAMPAAFITSDPGTGKTVCIIDDYNLEKDRQPYGRALILAPLSILEPSWGDDIDKFAPDLTWAIAHGKNKKAAFTSTAEMVLMNHDGVKWLDENTELLKDFNYICIDESTVYKHRTSQRSKAINRLMKHFEYRRLMTGTPNPNTVLDFWHQVYLLDGGARLCSKFFQYRSQVCAPKQVGPSVQHVKWEDIEGAEVMVADALSDITIRYKFEDCVDVPEHNKWFKHVALPSKVRKQYEEFNYNEQLITTQGKINAVHAGSKAKKLLQLLTGAVYDEHGDVHVIHSHRYELVISLVAERAASLVAFNWKHERDELCKLADKEKIKYAVIDGSVPVAERTEIVKKYQAGELQTIFAHPQSTSHGLTLTRGTSTIWCSPTYNAEHFQQFNRRIYRAGQTQKTETICIAAKNTCEMDVYKKLDGKLGRLEDILDIFTQTTKLKK